jgi:hypothetical protein
MHAETGIIYRKPKHGDSHSRTTGKSSIPWGDHKLNENERQRWSNPGPGIVTGLRFSAERKNLSNISLRNHYTNIMETLKDFSTAKDPFGFVQ